MALGENSVNPSDAHTVDFLRLLTKHEASLSAYILALVPHWSDAQDIAQDVRVALWEQFDNYDSNKDFGAWCRTIAHYKILAYRKRRSTRQAVLSPEFLEQVADKFQSAPHDEEARHRALVGCLRELPREVRDMLLRYYSGKQSIREMADESNKSYDSLRQSVVRVRMALKACIDRKLRGEASDS